MREFLSVIGLFRHLAADHVALGWGRSSLDNKNRPALPQGKGRGSNTSTVHIQHFLNDFTVWVVDSFSVLRRSIWKVLLDVLLLALNWHCTGLFIMSIMLHILSMHTNCNFVAEVQHFPQNLLDPEYTFVFFLSFLVFKNLWNRDNSQVYKTYSLRSVVV